MNDVRLFTVAVAIAILHGSLAYRNRLLLSGPGTSTSWRVSVVLSRFATATATIGWSSFAVGLILDEADMHRLSVLLAASVIVLIPLSLVCLMVSVLLRFTMRRRGFYQTTRMSCARTHRCTNSVLPIMAALGILIAKLAGAIAKWVVRSVGEQHEDHDRFLRFPVGSYFNARTGRYDDGSDPNGIYDDSLNGRF
jgi:hypothetical protein